MNIISFLGIVGTFLVSFWAFFKYVLLGSYRIDSDISKRLIDKIKKESSWNWVLAGEFSENRRHPNIFESFVLINRLFFFFSRNERLMTAGWKSKEDLSSITFFRWDRNKVDYLLKSGCSNNSIAISALSIGAKDHLGSLTPDPKAEPYLNKGSYEDIEEEVKCVLSGSVNKTGILLYGSPGNGKTQFIKYLSKKYVLPIYVVYLKPDYDNYDIARMFSEIPENCIVLFEELV